MTDPILGSMAYDCGDCGAKAGEDCADNCPGMEFVDFGDLEFPAGDVIDMVPDVEDSKAKLMGAVARLPFGGLTGTPPERVMMADDAQWLAELADYMSNYQQIATALVDDLQTQVRKGISNQIQLDVLRTVLTGVNA